MMYICEIMICIHCIIIYIYIAHSVLTVLTESCCHLRTITASEEAGEARPGLRMAVVPRWHNCIDTAELYCRYYRYLQIWYHWYHWYLDLTLLYICRIPYVYNLIAEFIGSSSSIWNTLADMFRHGQVRIIVLSVSCWIDIFFDR